MVTYVPGMDKSWVRFPQAALMTDTAQYRKYVIDYLQGQEFWCTYVGRDMIEVRRKWKLQAYWITIDGPSVLGCDTNINLHNPDSLQDIVKFIDKVL